MATNTQGTTARQDPRQVANTIKRTLNFGDPDVAQAAIGTLPSGNPIPAGAFITDVLVEVVTAFNAATTNTLSVGTNSGSWNNAIQTADVNLAATGVTRVSRAVGRALTAAADTTFYAVYAQSGAAATAGQAIIEISFEGGFSS